MPGRQPASEEESQTRDGYPGETTNSAAFPAARQQQFGGSDLQGRSLMSGAQISQGPPGIRVGIGLGELRVEGSRTSDAQLGS